MALSEQLEKSFKDPTPLYAIVGAGDLAVRKVRAVRADARERMAADVRELPDKAQAAISDVVSQAFTTYTELANRGKELLERMRDQPASQDFATQTHVLNDQVEVTVDTAMDAAEDTAGLVGEDPADPLGGSARG